MEFCNAIKNPRKCKESNYNTIFLFFRGGGERWGLLHSISGTVPKSYKLTVLCME